MADTVWVRRGGKKLDGLMSLIRLDSGVWVCKCWGGSADNPGVDLLQTGGMSGYVARAWESIALWAMILSLWMLRCWKVQWTRANVEDF